MEQFAVEDLLDFPSDDALISDEFFDSFAGNSTDSSTVTAVDSCGSQPHSYGDGGGGLPCRSLADAQFSGGELCVPCDDLAELEWLSNFVEESFSSEDLQKLQFLSGSGQKDPTHSSSSSETHVSEPGNMTRSPTPMLGPDVSVPGKARSKRSRAAPCDWSSRLLVLSRKPGTVPKPAKTTSSKKREPGLEQSDGRRCLHCASDKTPQWRTGPMGPKTLCNACGVRYKSGRLVPEYRPAASPTFVSTKHSNSHRKVLELRRQKDAQIAQHQQYVCQNPIFGLSDGGDYLIHHHVGSDFGPLI